MIYADYNGSAPLCDEVKKYLMNRLEQNGPYANPNTIHSIGVKVRGAMEKCRGICGEVLGADSRQIIFLSGATEGISTIFNSVLDATTINTNKVIIISSIEHSAVLNTARYWESRGYQLKILPVNGDGVVEMSEVKNLISTHKENIALISVMAANNETGVIQPIEEITKLASAFKIPVFSDTTQFIGKTSFHFKNSNLDFAVLSGHKVGAIVGSGLILVKNPEKLRPLLHGGGQENGLRGGTQNYIANETLAVALKDFEKNINQLSKQHECRANFEQRIKKAFPSVVVVGEKADRLAGTTLIAYPGIHGQAVQIELESQNIFVSTSSACSDNEPVTSKVLRAMKVHDDIGRGVIRISLGFKDFEQNYEAIYNGLTKAYDKLKRIQSF